MRIRITLTLEIVGVSLTEISQVEMTISHASLIHEISQNYDMKCTVTRLHIDIDCIQRCN